jgi:WD40 repeat protein
MQDGTRVVSASHDKTVKIWDVGGVDAQRASAPVKRAQQLMMRWVNLFRLHRIADVRRRHRLCVLAGVCCAGNSFKDGRKHFPGLFPMKTTGMFRSVIHTKGSSTQESPRAGLPGMEDVPTKLGALQVPQAPVGAHGDAVLSIVVSSDGKRAVSGALPSSCCRDFGFLR